LTDAFQEGVAALGKQKRKQIKLLLPVAPHEAQAKAKKGTNAAAPGTAPSPDPEAPGGFGIRLEDMKRKAPGGFGIRLEDVDRFRAPWDFANSKTDKRRGDEPPQPPRK
jgi:hypothetical protein